MTTAVPLTSLFLSDDELSEVVEAGKKSGDVPHHDGHHDNSDAMQHLMEDTDLSMNALKNSNVFAGDEERFAFARALSRLTEMGSQEWVERGLGLEHKGGKEEKDGWQKVRSRWREDSM